MKLEKWALVTEVVSGIVVVVTLDTLILEVRGHTAELRLEGTFIPDYTDWLDQAVHERFEK